MKKVLKPEEVEGVLTITDKYRQIEHNLCRKLLALNFCCFY